MLRDLGIGKKCRSAERRVQLTTEFKIGKIILPVNTWVTVWPNKLHDLELDSRIAMVRREGEIVTVYVKRGFVRSQPKPEPGRAVPGNRPRYISA